MPNVALLNLGVTSKAKTNALATEFIVTSRNNSTPADSLHLTATFTGSLYAALATSFRQLGVRIDIDRGDGTLTQLTGAEVGASISLSGSLDGYGRTLSFVRKAEPSEVSPFLSSWLRSLAQVRVTGYFGVPGSVQSRVMFDGYLRQGVFTAFPSTVSLNCQDTSLKYSNLKLAYNLAPGSLRSRKDVLLDILTQYAIPYGTLDLGANDGGVVFKGITAGGDQRLLDWIVEFLKPIGRRIRFVGGKLLVARFDGSAPSQRTLKSGDIANLQITGPATNDPNNVVVSSTVFGYIGPSGLRTETTIATTTGTYTPVVALTKQDHTTGALTTPTVSASAQTREIGRTVTATTYDGGTVVSRTIEQWGWYAPKACNKKQTAAGAITYNDLIDVFKFPDGTWRTTQEEQYQVIQRVWISRNFDANGVLLMEQVRSLGWAAVPTPLGQLNQTTGAEVPAVVYLTEAGDAWVNGVEEMFPTNGANAHDYTSISVFGAYPDGRLGGKTRFEGYQTLYRGQPISNSFVAAGTPYTLNHGTILPDYPIFYYGPSGARSYVWFQATTTTGPGTTSPDLNLGTPYGVFPFGILAFSVLEGYTPISETSFNLQIWEAYPVSPSFYTPNPTHPVAGNIIVNGAPPPVEVQTAKQSAQAATEAVADAVRQSLTGATVYDYLQNDFCETTGELRTAATELLRDLSAQHVEFDMPIDLTVMEGSTVTLSIPEITGATVNLIVWSIPSWSYDGTTGQNTQHVSARWYPPEIATS